jgi:hypothetical protein
VAGDSRWNGASEATKRTAAARCIRERSYTRTVETWTNASESWIRQRASSSVDREVTVTDFYYLQVAELPEAPFEIPDGATTRALGASRAQRKHAMRLQSCRRGRRTHRVPRKTALVPAQTCSSNE